MNFDIFHNISLTACLSS